MKSSHYSDQHLSSPVPEAKYKLVQSYYGMTIIINAHLQCRVQPVEQPSRNVTVLVVKQLVAYAIPSLLVGLRWWEGQEVWSKKKEGRMIGTYRRWFSVLITRLSGLNFLGYPLQSSSQAFVDGRALHINRSSVATAGIRPAVCTLLTTGSGHMLSRRFRRRHLIGQLSGSLR